MTRFRRFNHVVRCADGHLFVTTWIPFVSLKGVRLGRKRFQRCPVGHHWRMVEPVDEAILTDKQLVEAKTHRDLRIP